MFSFSVGVVLITHNARHHLPYCLPPLIQSPLNPRILLINSSSADGTCELAEAFGIEVLKIPRQSFNHGTTRELARRTLATDIVVMSTPDAYAQDQETLSKLIHPIISGAAEFSYARQLPHIGAGPFEAFPRSFNYPEKSHIRSLKDKELFGSYTFFLSDSFSAYLNSALDEVGGFSPVLTGEDAVVCSKLLQRGFRVAYVAEAEVRHSHRYSLLQEFKRHFDTGLARKSYREWIKAAGGDERRGQAYVVEFLSYLCQRKSYHLIPYALLQSFTKLLGYKLGEKCLNAPRFIKKLFSSQDFYWTVDGNPN